MPRARTAASILGAFVASAAIALGLAGCGVPEPVPTPTPSATALAPSGDGVLRIATVLSSGDAATAAQVAGVDVAVREINESGGWNGAPVEVIHRNAGEDAASAVAAVETLAGLGIDVVIGGSTSAQTEALERAAVDAGIALVALATFGDGVPSESTIAQLLGSDPGLTDFSGAAGARDAVIAVALAATVASDDGGASISSRLSSVLDGEVSCTAYGHCLEALDAGYSVAVGG